VLRLFRLASTAATIARTPSGGRITFEVIDLLASRADDLHKRVAVNMDPTAISESLSAALATLLGLRILEANADRVTAQLAIEDDLAAWAVPSTVAPMALADTVGAAATRLAPPRAPARPSSSPRPTSSPSVVPGA